MKKVFIAFVIATVFVSILGGTLAKRNRNSTDSGQSQAYQENSTDETPDPAERLVAPGRAATEEGENKAETADQILTDVSDANVTESTENLRHAFSRLSEICEIAVKTRDAMLLARYGDERNRTVSDEKGAENDNE